MKQYRWRTDRIDDRRIGTHQDRSGKYCPHRTLDMGINRFYDMIRKEYYAITGTTSNTTTIYRVQVGAFSKKENAENLAQELNTKGIDTYIVKVNEFYKVHCGAYTNAENSRNMAKKLNSRVYATYIAGLDESSSGEQIQVLHIKLICDYPNVRSAASLSSSRVRLGVKGEIVYVVAIENEFLKLPDGTYLKKGLVDKL